MVGKLGSDSEVDASSCREVTLRQMELLCWSPGWPFPKSSLLGKPGRQDGVQLLTENPGLLQPCCQPECPGVLQSCSFPHRGISKHREVIEVLWSKLKTPEKLLTTKPPQTIHPELLSSHTATARVHVQPQPAQLAASNHGSPPGPEAKPVVWAAWGQPAALAHSSDPGQPWGQM